MEGTRLGMGRGEHQLGRQPGAFLAELFLFSEMTRLSVSKQRVDIAKVASAHSATEDELAHACCTPLPGQPWKQKFQVVGPSGAQGISPPA